MKTYAEHLDAWEELDRLGYDGVGFNEHHTSPYGLMNSPNLMAAAAAQRTKKLKLLIYGNLIPLHSPLRLAEELAMIDCLSNGRLISGIARGIPREYQVHNVPLSESRARFEEAYEIITTRLDRGRVLIRRQVLVLQGRGRCGRGPCSSRTRRSGRRSPAAKSRSNGRPRHNVPITPGESRVHGLQHDIIRYYAKCLAQSGHRITPKHLSIAGAAYIADSKAQAVKEAGPYYLYFNRSLFSHGNVTETNIQRTLGYVSNSSLDYVSPENMREAQRLREDFRNLTMEDVARRAETMPWGTADEVRDRIIAAVDRTGADVVHLRMNTGAMPHDMFMNQIRLFAEKVLPALQAHQVKVVPAAEEVTA